MAGHPIVYASRGLPALTGYPRREVLGRNARVFQGAATDRAAVAGVREAVCAQRAHQIAILNYRRDGAPHWMLLHLAPAFYAQDGTLLHFLAVQVPIAARRGASQRTSLAACRGEARVEEDLPCTSLAGKVFVDMDKRDQCVPSGAMASGALSLAHPGTPHAKETELSAGDPPPMRGQDTVPSVVAIADVALS